MKKLCALLPIILSLLMITSSYMLVSDSFSVRNEYNQYLANARKYAKDGIAKYAIENYECALRIESTPEVYAEVADYYKSQKKDKEYLSWCQAFYDKYPNCVVPYEYLFEIYLNNEDYGSCYNLLNIANKRNVTSDRIKEIYKSIEYKFSLDSNRYEDVGVYSNNYCSVMNNGAWGFVDRYGNSRIANKYITAGTFTKSGFAPVINSENEAYFIDKSGAKVLVSKGKYKSFGLMINNTIAAQQNDGKYVYVNSDLNVLAGEYSYASTFNENIAAVKNNDEWSLIDNSGKPITNNTYSDIKLDEKGISIRNDRAFVSDGGGKYYMIDSGGKKIGNLEFEDARLFLGDSIAAVKINGKWSFVDAKGQLISDKKYDEVRSFSNGLAAVCVDGKWGFVDKNEKMVIEPQFISAKDFNDKGSCFIKNGDKWQLLKLYRLNSGG